MVAYIFWSTEMGGFSTRPSYYSTETTSSYSSCGTAWNLLLHNHWLVKLATGKTQVNVSIPKITSSMAFSIVFVLCFDWIRNLKFRLEYNKCKSVQVVFYWISSAIKLTNTLRTNCVYECHTVAFLLSNETRHASMRTFAGYINI